MICTEEELVVDPHTYGDTWYGWQIQLEETDEDGEVIGPADLTGCEVLIHFLRGRKTGPLGLELTAAVSFSSAAGSCTHSPSRRSH